MDRAVLALPPAGTRFSIKMNLSRQARCNARATALHKLRKPGAFVPLMEVII